MIHASNYFLGIKFNHITVLILLSVTCMRKIKRCCQKLYALSNIAHDIIGRWDLPVHE